VTQTAEIQLNTVLTMGTSRYGSIRYSRSKLRKRAGESEGKLPFLCTIGPVSVLGLLQHFTLALYSDPRSQDMLARNNMETCLASIFVLDPDPISGVYQGNQPLAINAAMRSW
jgi:hypothetical protein